MKETEWMTVQCMMMERITELKQAGRGCKEEQGVEEIMAMDWMTREVTPAVKQTTQVADEGGQDEHAEAVSGAGHLTYRNAGKGGWTAVDKEATIQGLINICLL